MSQSSADEGFSGQGTVHAFSGARDFTLGTANLAGRDFITVTNNYPISSASADASIGDVLQWLSPPSFEAIHHDVFSQRAKNTCNWFLESVEFERFLRDKGAILWGTGMPAAGKTTLVSVVVEHLNSMFGGHQDIGIAYAYLRYSEKKLHRDVLIGFIAQLVESREIALNHVKPKYNRAQASGSSLTEREAIQLLQDFAGMLKKLFLVVDGLDEVGDETKEDLLQSLSALGANVLIASRPLDLFKEFIPEALYMPIQARTEDIRLLVLERIQRSPRLKAILRGKAEMVEQLCDRIKEKSQGMFLVARLQMDALRNSNSIKNLFGTLEELPSGINDMYEQTLARIDAQPEEDASVARRMFFWLLHSKEPLGLEEMQHALAISFDQMAYEPDAIVDKLLILTFCGGLVTVQKQPRTVRFSDRGQVRFIHYTTREFMEKIDFPNYANPSSILSGACATYCISFSHSPGGRSTTLKSAPGHGHHDPIGQAHVAQDGDDIDPMDAAAARFYEYAISYWHKYAAEAQASGQPLHPSTISLMAGYRELGLPWCCPFHTSVLGLAVHFDLWSVISSGKLPYTEESVHAFHWAAVNGRIKALASLYAVYGAELESPSSSHEAQGSMHLHYLVRTGRPDLVKDFLSVSSSSPFLPNRPYRIEDFINARDADGLTPLMIACSPDNAYLVLPTYALVGIDPLAVLDLLLEFGCDVGARDNHGDSAFLRQIHGMKTSTPWHALNNLYKIPYRYRPHDRIRFRDEVIKRLLNFDPTIVNERDGRGRTALMRLATPEHEPGHTIEKLASFSSLLKLTRAIASPPANAKDGEGANVLMHASWSSRVVDWLCDNANVTDTTVSDALIFAFDPSNRGRIRSAVVETLMKQARRRSPGRGLFRYGWDSNLAIVLFIHALRHPCKHFLWMLLLCFGDQNRAAFLYSYPGPGFCHHCEVNWPPPSVDYPQCSPNMAAGSCSAVDADSEELNPSTLADAVTVELVADKALETD